MSFVTELPMSDKAVIVESASPPAYIMQPAAKASSGYSSKSKALFGYAVAVTTALVIVLIIGGVYYSRSVDDLQDIIKTYRHTDKTGTTPIQQDIEVNLGKNTLSFNLQGEGIAPGTVAVVDYSKSITGIYDPQARTCYLIGGIAKRIVDLKTYNNNMERNVTRPTTVETLQYQLADTYPVNDKAILPSPLKSQCTYLPVYWLEPQTKDKQKRACFYICGTIWGVRICWWRCW
jgi:hypothetical protein